MTLQEAIRVLVRGDGSRLPIVDTQALRMLFPADSDPAFNAGVRRLVECGLLERFARGVYANHGANRAASDALALVAGYLRPGCLIYLSYEFALSDMGSIGQIPFVYTMATTGASGRYRTPCGNVEFTHTERSDVEIVRRTVFDDRYGLLYAPPDMALEDFRRSRPHGAHLVDLEDHAEILEEWYGPGARNRAGARNRHAA